MRLQQIELPGQTLTAMTDNDDRTGTPVVFIHGFTATVGVWLPAMPAVVRNERRWVSLSLPGHHPARIDRQSFGPWKDVTSEQWAEWYDTVLRELLGDQPVDIVGWSTGGFTALALAAYFPKRVNRVLSISGFANGRVLNLFPGCQFFSTRRWLHWLIAGGFGAIHRHRFALDLVAETGVADHQAFRNSSIRRETLDEWFAAFSQHDPVVIAEFLGKIVLFDLTDQLARIDRPVCIAAGMSDPYIALRHARWMAEQIPGAELVLWPSAGHLFFCERTDDYQKLLLRWLGA